MFYAPKAKGATGLSPLAFQGTAPRAEAGSLCYTGLPDGRAISQSHPGSYCRAPGVTTRRR